VGAAPILSPVVYEEVASEV
jgi:hypothetical protein